MQTLTATQARSDLYRLIDRASETHLPLLITSKRHNAILISAENWATLQETAHLCAMPGMRDSILAGLSEPIDACATEISW